MVSLRNLTLTDINGLGRLLIHSLAAFLRLLYLLSIPTQPRFDINNLPYVGKTIAELELEFRGNVWMKSQPY
jgi:hypothetical protein